MSPLYKNGAVTGWLIALLSFAPSVWRVDRTHVAYIWVLLYRAAVTVWHAVAETVIGRITAVAIRIRLPASTSVAVRCHSHVRPVGFEPTLPWLKARYANRYTTGAFLVVPKVLVNVVHSSRLSRTGFQDGVA